MRQIPYTGNSEVYETEVGRYVILGMKMQNLPDTHAPIPVQDLDNPLCSIMFQEGVSEEDLLAIIIDRLQRKSSDEYLSALDLCKAALDKLHLGEKP